MTWVDYTSASQNHFGRLGCVASNGVFDDELTGVRDMEEASVAGYVVSTLSAAVNAHVAESKCMVFALT